METTFFHNATIYTGSSMINNGYLLITNGIIEQFGEGMPPVPSNVASKDLRGLSVAPGLIDLQLYGGGGHFFNHVPEVETIKGICEHAIRSGTSGVLVTLSTTPLETIYKAIEASRKALDLKIPGFLGLHLEGPYIHHEKRGAHVAAFVRNRFDRELQEILARGAGVVKIMTLAPELFSPEELNAVLAAGISVSAGHTMTSFAEGVRAFEAGIPLATHLFNAMTPLQGREPGMVGAIYDSLPYTSIVNDGIHVDFASVRISKKIMGDRLFFITDAVDHHADGPYNFHLENDRWVTESGTLAGSALTLLKAVKNGVDKVGIPLDEALRMASLYPAKALGIKNAGLIDEGRPANLVFFDKDILLKGVVHGGVTIS